MLTTSWPLGNVTLKVLDLSAQISFYNASGFRELTHAEGGATLAAGDGLHLAVQTAPSLKPRPNSSLPDFSTSRFWYPIAKRSVHSSATRLDTNGISSVPPTIWSAKRSIFPVPKARASKVTLTVLANLALTAPYQHGHSSARS
jgi:hypothetical protein